MALLKKLTECLNYKLEPIIFLSTMGDIEKIGHEFLIRVKGDKSASKEMLDQIINDPHNNREYLSWKKVMITEIIENDPATKIAINLAPQQLLYEGTWDFLAEMSPYTKNIVIEITEKPSINVSLDITKCLQSIREYGYCAALDDIGKQQNDYHMVMDNINLLSYLKVSLLDLAQLDDEQKLFVVLGWKKVASRHDIKLIVEGVDNEKMVQRLAKLGCLQQGYFWD